VVHLGVDLGGTAIKVGLVDDGGELLSSRSVPTGLPRPPQAICRDIVASATQLLEQENLSWEQVKDLGAGAPGTVNPDRGVVIHAANLGWWDFPLREELSRLLPRNLPVYIQNDANVAAVGEYLAGSAKGAASAVVLTIGTGVGSGIILNHRIESGHYFGGGEFGHMVIVQGGRSCNCGRKGCFEAYASATGLIHLTEEEMVRSPESLMHSIAAQQGKVNGRTAFDAMRAGDQAGSRVVDLFLSYLACGIANIINALQPELICLGGGISKEGDTLLLPLREKVNREIYGGSQLPSTRLQICTLGNHAGMIGAAMLGRMQE
jgi:glucokinase